MPDTNEAAFDNSQLQALRRQATGETVLPNNVTWGQPPADNSIMSQILQLPADTARVVSGWLDRSNKVAKDVGTDKPPAVAAVAAAAAPAKVRSGLPATKASTGTGSAGPTTQGLPSSEGDSGGGGADLLFSGSLDTPQPTNSTVTAAATKKSLPELYAELIGKSNPKVNRDITPQQAAEARSTYLANLMRGGPEAQVADSFRMAHNAAQGQIDKARAENIDLEKLRIGQERGDAANIVGATDKEADNQRADKTQNATEQHQTRMDANTAEHMKLLKQQIEQGNYKVLPAKGGKTYAIFNVKTGEAKDTGLPIDRSGTDSRPAEVKLIEYFTKNPEALKMYQSMHGDKSNEGKDDLNVNRLVDKFTADFLKDGTNNPEQLDTRIRSLTESLTGRRNGTTPAGPMRFNTPAEARSAKAAGTIKVGDTIQTPNGPIVVK